MLPSWLLIELMAILSSLGLGVESLERQSDWVSQWLSQQKSQIIRIPVLGRSQWDPERINWLFKSFLRFLFQHFVCFFNRTSKLSIQLALTSPVLSIWSISYSTNPSESFEDWSWISIGTIISIIQIIRCSSIKYSIICFWSFHWNILNDFWRFQRIFDITVNTSFEVLFEVQGLI